MPGPIAVALVAGEWTKVYTNTTTGSIYLASLTPNNYLTDYRATGGAAPADESTAIPPDSMFITVNSSTAIDVYIKSKAANGSVIVAG